MAPSFLVAFLGASLDGSFLAVAFLLGAVVVGAFFLGAFFLGASFFGVFIEAKASVLKMVAALAEWSV